MEKAITDRRGILIILVIVTVVIFIGLVWVIATYLPVSLSNSPSASPTGNVARAQANCAAPVPYWQAHPDLYPAQLVIAGQVYQAQELEQIFAGQNGDLASQLRAQLTAAYLNISAGADQNYIETTMFEAYGWLVGHSPGTDASGGDLVEGTRLYTLLEAYNRGQTGVALCPAAAAYKIDATSTPSDTPTLTPSVTPSPFPTSTESVTPTAIEFTATSTYSYIAPSRTPAPTSKPPDQYPTSVPPTQQPAPTSAPPPPLATPTFELPPLPTATYELPPPP